MAEATADKPWLNLYPATVPREVDLAAYSNLADLIEEALTKYADRVAFHCSGTDLTYRELDRLSSAFAVHLAKHGFQKGIVSH